MRKTVCDSALLVVLTSSWRGGAEQRSGLGILPRAGRGSKGSFSDAPRVSLWCGQGGKEGWKTFLDPSWRRIDWLCLPSHPPPPPVCLRCFLFKEFVCLRNYSPITSNITDFVGVSRPNISDGTEHMPWELTSWIALSHGTHSSQNSTDSVPKNGRS